MYHGIEVLFRGVGGPSALHGAHAEGITVLGQEDALELFPSTFLALPIVRVLNHTGLNNTKSPSTYAACGRSELMTATTV